MSSDSNSGRLTLRRGGARYWDRFADGWDRLRSSRAGGWAGALWRGLRSVWRRRWAKALVVLLASPFVILLILYLIFAPGLPSADTLLSYEPPLPSYVRDIDGDPAHSFARERRVELQYEEFPPHLINAFLAAEDRTFFRHGGIDYPGFAGAIFDFARKAGSGERARGGSTITQQVAKNLLLGDEYSVTRKIREFFLAWRIESVLEKEQILELYLNQIFLGRNAYGVQAAARAYFDKDVEELAIHEAAFLAILPQAPSQYSSERRAAFALQRRNWVLSEMERSAFITPAQRADAAARPLGLIRSGQARSLQNVGGYYMEEVRRQLVARYGQEAERGANGVYSGGLWIRSSYDPRMQRAAETALRDGLARYERGRGWRDSGLTIDIEGDWRSRLALADYGVGDPDWRSAVILSREPGAATIGFTDGSTGTLPASLAAMPRRGTGTPAFAALRPGMIVAVEREGAEAGDGTAWALRSIPEVSGGFVAEQVATGRVLAMQGGWAMSGGQSFNRATQAQRQPGSTFKPFVYAAALDNGMTPASIIVDGPFCVWQGGALGQKCFRNFSGGYAGPQTMRWGLEQSRNLMTVRAANQVGMDQVIRQAGRVGLRQPNGEPYPNFLAIALGAGDTTVLDITNAFAILANHGRELRPSLIDYVQDRRGRVILRADNRCRLMENCNAADWDGRPMPRPPLRARQVMDPMTAFQVVHMLTGVVERGTATILRDLERPLFGKTGTSTGPDNVWFIGGSADIVAGVYMGFDRPRSMGGYAQGGTIAAPIFRQFAREAFEGMPVVPFRAPAGIRMVRVDRRSGERVYGVWPPSDPRAGVIWEAFRPESEPRRNIRRDQEAAAAEAKATRPRPVRRRPVAPSAPSEPAPQESTDSLQSEDGIY
ncbi:MAG TPA: PBP1A family penicillin-binding protein [Allosphingosinicella sp.]|nr:PBP1A family penicillin-binding protein [Allosphingosinicella sp.]